MRLIATAAFGLESVVARELLALGYESRASRPGWLAFEGDEAAIARANLWLRASDRVLLELASFHASDFGALFDHARAVAWERWLPRNARILVRGRSVKSQLRSVPACQRIVKKAIVERLKEIWKVGSLPEDGPSFAVEIALLQNEARVLLDSSGAGLHKRGYRPASGPAPLKETLAAGLVLLSGFRRGRPFLDPFCGTGTIAIEAALLARNRAPGIARSFDSELFAPIPEKVWREAREEARDLEIASEPAEPIEASDRDEESITRARRSAERASVSRDIRFERRSFAEISTDRPNGYLVTNPPYGERSGEAADVRELYRSMPGIFRRFAGWSFFVLTSRRDFEKLVGQEATRRRKLYNGDLECTFYQFLASKPGPSAEARPAFGGLDERASRQAEIFANRLRKRAHHLRKWPAKRGTDLYRLYERDIKEVPLVVDRYGDALLVSPTGDRLESRTRAEHEDWLDLMARTAAVTLGVPPDGTILRGRRREPIRLTVREEGLVFETQVSADGIPGITPADRALRAWVRERAGGRRVLVLYSRAGTFAVAAAAGGALSTTSVAPEPTGAEEARRNFALSSLPSDRHRIVPADPTYFLESDPGSYELVVVPAPGLEVSFLHPLLSRMAPGTSVLLWTPRFRDKLDRDAFAGWETEDVTSNTISEEFRDRRTHRAYHLRRS